MTILQITTSSDNAMRQLHEWFDFGNPIFQLIILAIVLLNFWALGKNMMKPYPIINAEIYFKNNSKVILSGDFEVWAHDRYKHLESGAIIYKSDILFIKNKKYIKTTVKEKITL